MADPLNIDIAGTPTVHTMHLWLQKVAEVAGLYKLGNDNMPIIHTAT